MMKLNVGVFNPLTSYNSRFEEEGLLSYTSEVFHACTSDEHAILTFKR